MGWAFADFQNSFPNLSTNTIIYGHTYKQTTIFSKLKNVLKDTWLNNQKYQKITLDTEQERLIFQVYSIYTTKDTNDYLFINFNNQNKYNNYLDKSIKRSIKKFNIRPSVNDKILTLSTCYTDENQRLVVQAVLVDSV